MIDLQFMIKLEGFPATKNFVRSELPKAMKASYRHIADVWQREMRPKHFTPAGATEYGYKPRTKGYQLFKVSKAAKNAKGVSSMRTTDPLVFTGHSQRAAMNPRIVATSKHAQIFINAPNLNWNPERVREMTEISTAENQRLANEFGDVLASILSKWPAARVVVAT
jgi:hypothetical protein